MDYLVKCDECKQTIRETESIRESYEGGRCDACRGDWASRVIGKWPGDETDDEIAAALSELS